MYGDAADLDGMCGFRAVQSVLAYLDAPAIVEDDKIFEFCDKKLEDSNGRIDLLESGVTYGQLASFIHCLPKDLGALRIGNNIYNGSKCGWKAVEACCGDDGVYLVCGKSNFVKTGHVLALKKSGNAIRAKDDLGETELNQQSWIHEISYVRRVWWCPSQ